MGKAAAILTTTLAWAVQKLPSLFDDLLRQVGFLFERNIFAHTLSEKKIVIGQQARKEWQKLRWSSQLPLCNSGVRL